LGGRRHLAQRVLLRARRLLALHVLGGDLLLVDLVLVRHPVGIGLVLLVLNVFEARLSLLTFIESAASREDSAAERDCG
jgi:hypothetical protein